MNPKVDGYIRKNKQWQAELRALQAILLDCSLTEEVKWRVPCYTFEKRNIALIGAAKEYCALSFFKGSLLKDADGILIKPGRNTQAARMIRFTEAQQIRDLEPVLKAHLQEAVEVEKAGLKVTYKETSEYPFPKELQARLDEDPAFKAAFEALTPGRQRGYLLYFSSAKQSKTRASRIAKYEQHILDGKGMHDDYAMRGAKPRK